MQAKNCQCDVKIKNKSTFSVLRNTLKVTYLVRLKSVHKKIKLKVMHKKRRKLAALHFFRKIRTPRHTYIKNS